MRKLCVIFVCIPAFLFSQQSDDGLDTSYNEKTPQINTHPTLELDTDSVVSDLKDLEAYFIKDSVLSSKFESFKQTGIEKPLNVSYFDMQRVISKTRTYIGTQHVIGGLSYSGIDCSGLLYVSFQEIGITDIARTAEEFARYGSVILNPKNIQEGDLIFFTNTYASSALATHAGICIGNGEFIHASANKGVMISKINDPYYWMPHFLFGTRVIGQ